MTDIQIIQAIVLIEVIIMWIIAGYILYKEKNSQHPINSQEQKRRKRF